MPRYPRDPYWLTAKFNSTCPKCKETIKKGQQAFYYPSTRECYCQKDSCGGNASREFTAAAEDEAFMCSQFPDGSYEFCD